MFDSIKQALRITTTAFDEEVRDLVEAARSELIQAGVSSDKANDDRDPLIKRAVIVYCKANFGYDNPEAERFQNSFELIKQQLSMAGDYNTTQ